MRLGAGFRTKGAAAWAGGKYVRAALPVFLGVALALAAVHYLAPAPGRIGPFRVEMGAHLTPQGETTLAFPPFGEVSASTHQLVPVEVRFSLTGVDLPALETWVGESGSAGAALTSAEGSLKQLAGSFLLRALVLAVLLGASGAYLCSGKRSVAAVGAVTGGLTVALLAGAVAVDFDREAFVHPRYEGALEAAPWVIGLLEKNWSRVGTLGDQMESLARNLSGLSEQLGDLAVVARPPADLRLLHVSDIHNNAVGVEFIAEAVKAFGVDAVVDTGDLTDWGTPLEVDLVREIGELRVPYFFVPGNHDSAELVSKLREYRQVRVLDGPPVNFRGLVILGAADPSSVNNDPAPAPAEELRALGEALAQRIDALPRPPDVVAVHNGLAAGEVAGKAAVVLFGHDHRLAVRESRGTTLIDAGTTGAAGIRGIQNAKEIPYSMALLYFSRTSQGYRLRAVDTLEVRGRTAGFALNRILVGDGGNPEGTGEATSDGSGARPAETGR